MKESLFILLIDIGGAETVEEVISPNANDGIMHKSCTWKMLINMEVNANEVSWVGSGGEVIT